MTKMTKIIQIPIILLVLSNLAFGSACWKIKDKDQKAYCEAKYENKHSCWKIKDKDLRSLCEAEAYGTRTCWKIKDANKKALCESEISKGK